MLVHCTCVKHVRSSEIGTREGALVGLDTSADPEAPGPLVRQGSIPEMQSNAQEKTPLGAGPKHPAQSHLEQADEKVFSWPPLHSDSGFSSSFRSFLCEGSRAVGYFPPNVVNISGSIF